MDGARIADVRVGEYLAADVMKCVGKNSFVYLNKFEKIYDRGYSFNWCAGVFTSLWFAYRKMWKAAAGLMVFNAAYSVVYSLVEKRMVSSGNGAALAGGAVILFLVSVIAFGLLGDWLYCRQVGRILDEQGCRGRAAVEKSALDQSLRKAGGTSIKGLVLFWGISLVLNWAIYWII